tara:strand:- start:9850 stop:14466 length:4617 start_codon:yes stop_codon:yes gene_type:complete
MALSKKKKRTSRQVSHINDIQNFTAQTGAIQGEIRFGFDIPDNWYPGGIKFHHYTEETLQYYYDSARSMGGSETGLFNWFQPNQPYTNADLYFINNGIMMTLPAMNITSEDIPAIELTPGHDMEGSYGWNLNYETMRSLLETDACADIWHGDRMNSGVYQFSRSRIGSPYPIISWLGGIFEDNDNLTDVNEHYEPSADFGWQFAPEVTSPINIHKCVIAPLTPEIEALGAPIWNTDIEEEIGWTEFKNQELNEFNIGEFTGSGTNGRCRPLQSEICTPREAAEAIAAANWDYNPGNNEDFETPILDGYVVITGCRWVPSIEANNPDQTVGKYVFDPSDAQLAVPNNGFTNANIDPCGERRGVGIVSYVRRDGPFYEGPERTDYMMNPCFNPQYGTPESVGITHEFKQGGFIVVARPYSPTNEVALDSSLDLSGDVPEPSNAMLTRFADRNYDSTNYWSTFIYPSDDEWANGRIERLATPGEGTWYFMVFYSTGHQVFSDEPHISGTTSCANQQNQGDNNDIATYGGFGPLSSQAESMGQPYLNPNFPISEPLSAALSNPWEDVLLPMHPNRSAMVNFRPVLTGINDNFAPQDGIFRSEVQCNLHLKHYLEYYEQTSSDGNQTWNMTTLLGGHYGDAQDINDALGTNYDGTEGSLAVTTIEHYPKWNGAKLRSLGTVTFAEWAEGRSYASSTASTDTDEFRFSMCTSPFLRRKWDSSYQTDWFRSHNQGQTMPELIKELYDNNHLNNLTEAFLNQLHTSMGIAAYGYGDGGDQNYYSYIATIYTYLTNFQFSTAWDGGIPNFNPETGGYPSGQARISQYYLRLDNELVFTFDSQSVPDDFICRIINITESGNFTEVADENEAPVYNDYLKSDLIDAPWWDFFGTLTSKGITNANSLDAATLKSYKRLVHPIDTTFEQDGDYEYLVLCGRYNPSAPVIESITPTPYQGGGYGMRLFTETFTNQNEYSTQSTEESIIITVNNKGPDFSLNPVESANPAEATGQRRLTSSFTSDIPILYTNNTSQGDLDLLQTTGPHEVDNFEHDLYSWAGLSSTGEGYESYDNIAVAGILDWAGNYISSFSTWDFVWPSGNGSVQGNINRLFPFGQEYTIDTLGILNWAFPGPDGWEYSAASSGEFPNQQCIIAGFSTWPVLQKYLLANGMSFAADNIYTAMDNGYWSYDYAYNHTSLGDRWLLEKQADDNYEVTEADIYMSQKYNSISRVGFHVMEEHMPTATDIDAWDGQYVEKIITLAPVNGGNISTYVIKGDPWFLGVFDTLSGEIDNHSQLKFKVDYGCLAYEKDCVFPFGGWEHPSQLNPTSPVIAHVCVGRKTTKPERMSSPAYFTPFSESNCDINPEYTYVEPDPIEIEDFTGVSKNIYWYSPLSKRWDIESVPKISATDNNENILNTFMGKKGEIFIGKDAVLSNVFPLLEAEASDSYKSFSWVSKRINMRAASQKKMFYKVRLVKLKSSGKITVFIRTDNSSSYTTLGVTSDISTDFKIPKSLRRGRWIQVMVVSGGDESDNLYPATISSLTIIWRQKPIK